MEPTYKIGEVATKTEIPKLGRNKLYNILKRQGIVDNFNRPEQRYIDDGLLTRPISKNDICGWKIWRNVTLAIGTRGIEFVKEIALQFLKDNPMPTFPHRSKVSTGINI